jgi:hypothetical protein
METRSNAGENWLGLGSPTPASVWLPFDGPLVDAADDRDRGHLRCAPPSRNSSSRCDELEKEKGLA